MRRAFWTMVLLMAWVLSGCGGSSDAPVVSDPVSQQQTSTLADEATVGLATLE